MTAVKNWIQCHPSGLAFNPLKPERALLRITDQAHALSMQCRYAGHVERFYSVAEHAVRVSRRVEQLLIERGYPDDSHMVLYAAAWGLIHDNSEAYLNDVVRPVKHTDIMAGYREAEHRLQGDIAEWLGLERDEPDMVRYVDNEILGTEARQLKAPVHPEWGLTCPGGQLPAEIPGLVLGWSQARAKEIYLRRFRRLFPKHTP